MITCMHHQRQLILHANKQQHVCTRKIRAHAGILSRKWHSTIPLNLHWKTTLHQLVVQIRTRPLTYGLTDLTNICITAEEI